MTTAPPGWIHVYLGDCIDLVAGVGFPKRLQGQKNEAIPVYKVGDISSLAASGGRYLRESPNTLSFQEAEGLARRLVPSNATAFAKTGAAIALNRRAVTTQPCLIDNNVFAAVPSKECLDPIFLYYFLRTVRLEKFSRATTVPSLRKGDVQGIEFPLAPRREQRRVVEALDSYLSRLDAAEEGLKRVEANLKRYRASVLKAAVEGRLVPTEAELARQEGRDYEPASVLLERILKERRRRWEKAELAKMKAKREIPKNDRWKAKYKEPIVPDQGDLPPVSEGWCWAQMDALAQHDHGAIGAGPFGTIFKARDFRPEGVTIIFLRHVKPGRYLTEKPTYMDREKWEELFRPYSVFGGELLVTKLGDPPGYAAIFPRGIEPAMVTPDVMKMKVNDAIVLPRYLMHFMNSEPAREYAFGAAFGTTRLRLTLPTFRNIPVPLPPLAEQLRIVETVEELFSVADETETSTLFEGKRINSLRQAILKWAFEGKLVDQDPNDEPASALLERIRANRPPPRRKSGRKRGTQMSLDI